MIALIDKIKSQVYSGRGLAVLVGFIFLVVVSNFINFGLNQNSNDEVSIVDDDEIIPAFQVESLLMESSVPARLRIPKIKIDVNFVAPLGLESNGEVEVPDSYTEVGWYKYSPTPGQIGPAIVLGHVDSYTGPAVFFSLGQIDEGDDIFIEREDGTTAHFKVEKLERYKQSEFPTQKVYGNINYAGLRLITCTGTYERGKQSYTHNLVVYAKLVSE